MRHLLGVRCCPGILGYPAVQYRLARATILLMGFSGIQAAIATRDKLKPLPPLPGLAE
jgi:hypothetical protein